MNIFDEITKLINEHGSATILKERILLLKDQYAVLIDKTTSYEKEISNLSSKISELEKQISGLQHDNKNLQLDKNNLKNEVESFHSSNPDNHFCEACGSNNLKRTGSVPNKTFKRLGVKDAVFMCNDCGKKSSFIIDRK